MHSDLNSSYKNLNDLELLRLTLCAAKNEKDATLALLNYLVEVDSRRLYAMVNSCSSLFEFVVKELGLSEPAAAERVNAVRLMRAVPEVKKHLENGALNLTNTAKIQRFVAIEQKANTHGKAVTPEEKKKLVEECLGKSKREVEKTLLEKQSAPARKIGREKIKLVTPTRSEIKFTADEKTLIKLNRLKDLIGNQSLEKIFDQALDALLVHEQKKRGMTDRKPTKKNARPKKAGTNQAHDAKLNRPAEFEKMKNEGQLNSRFIPIDIKRFVFARSKGQCEFVDPRTQQRCHSTFRLQIDHVLPLAHNGKTETTNLRHLCSAHNLRTASDNGLSRPSQATH